VNDRKQQGGCKKNLKIIVTGEWDEGVTISSKMENNW
jgi:hypothetical protein